jgi:hypothetical protein
VPEISSAPGNGAARIDESLHGDDGSRETAFHVARAAAEELAVAHRSGKRLEGPARAGLHDVDMAVEVHARSRQSALAARDHIEARPSLAVAGSTLGTHVREPEAAPREPAADEFRAGAIRFPRRIHRRKADQLPGELDELLAAPLDGGAQSVDELGG